MSVSIMVSCDGLDCAAFATVPLDTAIASAAVIDGWGWAVDDSDPLGHRHYCSACSAKPPYCDRIAAAKARPTVKARVSPT